VSGSLILLLLGEGGGADEFWCRWVQTELGQVLADAIGFPQPPMSVEESARGVLEQVCFFFS
jgi:hypothetical protein